MSISDDLPGIGYIALKDVKSYCLKPSVINWGVLFPLALSLAFYVRSSEDFREMMPGLVALTTLFSSIAMETAVVGIELRRGTLERLFLAPMSFAAVVMGKVLGGLLFGLGVSFVLTIVCIIGLGLWRWSLLWLLPVLLFSALAFSSLGALISVAWRKVIEARTLANLVCFPMIFLCGVFVPLSSLPPLLRGIAYLLPLTYAVEGVEGAVSSLSLVAMLVNLLVLVAFAAIFLLLALLILRKRLA